MIIYLFKFNLISTPASKLQFDDVVGSYGYNEKIKGILKRLLTVSTVSTQMLRQRYASPTSVLRWRYASVES